MPKHCHADSCISEVAGILKLGLFSIVVQLIRRPMTTEHHNYNKQIVTQGLFLPQCTTQPELIS